MDIDPAPTPQPEQLIAAFEAQLAEGAETLGRERALFKAQIASMQAVVEAACALIDDDDKMSEDDLKAAVGAYRTALAQPPAEQGKADGS